jgi:hypothetical protein
MVVVTGWVVVVVTGWVVVVVTGWVVVVVTGWVVVVGGTELSVLPASCPKPLAHVPL